MVFDWCVAASELAPAASREKNRVKTNVVFMLQDARAISVSKTI